MVAGPLAESLLGKAQEKGLLRARVMDIREFATGKHRVTDDVPYGGGAGMVMKPEPLVAAIEAARAGLPGAHVVLLSPQGARFDQRKAEELAARERLVLVCGRYEGVDERVLGNEESAARESFAGEMVLEGPQYTRPPEFRGAEVPKALLSGDHARIARWRRRQALLRTRDRRPDLFEKLRLSPEDLRLLEREEA